jgi:hypothetical protein
MAYSNWGAEVWCDDKPLHENCDATPMQVLGKQEPFVTYWEGFLPGPDRDDPLRRMYHAVMGDAQSEILIALYKDDLAGLFFVASDSIEKLDCPKMYTDDYEKIEGTIVDIHGVEVTIDPDDNRIHASFTDHLGRKWRATSGFEYGEGHQTWG